MRSPSLLKLVRQIESDERLEPLIERIHSAVSAAATRFGGRELLSGSDIGHPVHPLLVSLPIGCFTSAMLADFASEPDAACKLTGTGILTAFPTMATGLSDWVDTAGAERRVGFLHLSANLLALTFYTASWRARRRGAKRGGQVWSLAGATVMTAAGWLGGHLAYGMGVGVDTNAFAGGPTEWTEIARPGDSPNHRAEVAGVALAILEDDSGNPRVLADRCSHRGGPLSQGAVTNGCVTCPWHGSRFDLEDGHVVRGPASAPQPVYEVRVSGEGTEVRRVEPRVLRVNPV